MAVIKIVPFPTPISAKPDPALLADINLHIEAASQDMAEVQKKISSLVVDVDSLITDVTVLKEDIQVGNALWNGLENSIQEFHNDFTDTSGMRTLYRLTPDFKIGQPEQNRMFLLDQPTIKEFECYVIEAKGFDIVDGRYQSFTGTTLASPELEEYVIANNVAGTSISRNGMVKLSTPNGESKHSTALVSLEIFPAAYDLGSSGYQLNILCRMDISQHESQLPYTQIYLRV